MTSETSWHHQLGWGLRNGARAVPALWLAALSPSAVGQETPPADAGASVVETEGTPEVLVIGFEDANPDDCNEKIARYGRCVEEVRFSEMGPAWSTDAVPTDADRARWKATGVLYADLWDDLSHRFLVDTDPIFESMRARGVVALPAGKQQWQASARDAGDLDRAVYSLPRESSWLGAAEWIDARTWRPAVSLTPTELIGGTDAIFPVVRVNKAPGLVASDSMLILKGRFAQRLAADGKRHPWDIMDGDPEASAPLFEQMYPYQRGLAQEATGADDSEVPLTRFIAQEMLKSPSAADLVGFRKQNYADTLLPGPESTSYAFMTDQAQTEFQRFYRLVGTQILRFAREEYTPTHIRVLTSLMAMESPPGTLKGGYATSDDVVAASRGQMDTVDPTITAFRGYASSRDGFALNFVELPEELVAKHIVTMSEWNNPTNEFLDLLLSEVVETLRDHLREDVVEEYLDNPGLVYRKSKDFNRARFERDILLPWVRDNMGRWRIRSLDDAAITTWIQDNSFPGRVPIVTRYFRRLALDLLVSRLDADDREKIQTRILLDHLNLEIKKGFGGSDAPIATPGAIEERSKNEWLKVLSAHAMYPGAIPDRPGVVNPLAICTLSDRLDALEEPSFGRVNLDLIVVGPTALTTAEELLWQVREDVPFILVDDPERNPPAVTRLVGLPGDRAVYRVRWEVWSGWHLLWGVEPLDASSADAPRRMALRTGAVCADTVLASPDLVPTLLRAALLDGEFRPTVPVRDVGKTLKPTRKKTNDKTVVDADQAIETADDERGTVETTVAAAQGDQDAIVSTARNLIGGLTYLKPGSKRTRGVDTRPVEQEAVLYVRDLFLSPLRARDVGRPMMVSVFDHATPSAEKDRVWDFQPRTPYGHTQVKYLDAEAGGERRADQVRFQHTTGWASVLQPPLATQPLWMVSPAHLPTELLNTAELKQVWKRRQTSDWNFGGGVGFYPYRYVHYSCNEEPSVGDLWSATVTDCDQGEPLTATSETSGISLDLFALNTRWMIGDRRTAIEFGPELHLDLLPPGRNKFYEGDQVSLGISSTDDGEDISESTKYAWATRFQAGIVVGVRFAPDPLHLSRSSSRRYPWGAPLPDGSSTLGRVHTGLRAGLMLGPTFDGLEATVLTEWWMGWSLRFDRSPQASFTPYHPAILIGPYVRGQLGLPLVGNPSRYLKLDYSGMVIVGVRAHFRLTAQPEIKFEAPK